MIIVGQVFLVFTQKKPERKVVERKKARRLNDNEREIKQKLRLNKSWVELSHTFL